MARGFSSTTWEWPSFRSRTPTTSRRVAAAVADPDKGVRFRRPERLISVPRPPGAVQASSATATPGGPLSLALPSLPGVSPGVGYLLG